MIDLEFERIQINLKNNTKKWLITGVAGFIGSNLLEKLLSLNQQVVGLDNLSTGYHCNLAEVQSSVTTEQWSRFHFIEGDIRDLEICRLACIDIEYILHQAALGSVSRSIKEPILTNQNNINGFLNMLVAARDANVKRFVYAASSSTYGDHPDLPKVEDVIGKPLSPYAVTKLVNEIYAEVFSRNYCFDSIGLRYFNVFGRRQDKNGAYSAVIPSWITAMINNQPVYINGDGETSRDFCYVDNVVQANLLAALSENSEAINQVYNIAAGKRTSLNQLYSILQYKLVSKYDHIIESKPVYRDFRSGDVRHSLADISKAKKLLYYKPEFQVDKGLDLALIWYINHR